MLLVISSWVCHIPIARRRRLESGRKTCNNNHGIALSINQYEVINISRSLQCRCRLCKFDLSRAQSLQAHTPLESLPEYHIHQSVWHLFEMGKLSMPSKAEVAAPFRSREAFVNFLKAPQGNEGHNTVGDSRWSNKDLEPTAVEDRTWTW